MSRTLGAMQLAFELTQGLPKVVPGIVEYD